MSQQEEALWLSVEDLWSKTVDTVQARIRTQSDEALRLVHSQLVEASMEYAKEDEDADPASLTMAATIWLIEAEQEDRHIKTCEKCKAGSRSHLH